MFNLSVRNAKGEILDLTNDRRYDLYNIDGLNPTPATLNFSQLANYDGSIYNSGQLGNRNIVLYIKIHNDAESNRINLYKYFQLKKMIRIFYENNTRSVYIDGYVETFETEYFSMNEVVQISIICPNPYWKADEETQIDFSNTIDLFEFPFSIPEEGIEFSRIEYITTAYINNGEIESGMTIEFRANTSQILNPKFINRTTQEYFALNFDMNAGDIIRVNTRRGEKSVMLIRDGVETNIINDMQTGSKWVHLAPGLNELSYECDEGQANLTVYVYATKCYEGV